MADLVRLDSLAASKLPLSDSDIAELLAQHGVNERGQALVRTIRTTLPATRSTGRYGNVTGRYPSAKMRFTIGYDSRTGELAFIVLCETDADVFEYYDHPIELTLDYRSASGRRCVHAYTPDFFVLGKAFADLVEVKPESVLRNLVEASPHRYEATAEGGFRSPPAEAAAAEFGLGYRLWTPSREVQVLADNLRFLQASFGQCPSGLTGERIEELRALVQSEPGVTLESVVHQVADPGSVFWCVFTGHLYVDLKATPVSHTDRARVFASAGEEAIWRAALESADRSELRPDPEETLRRAKLSQYPPKALDVAHKRYRILHPILEAGTTTGELARQKRSTCIRWLTAYRKAQRDQGVGLLGLVPRTHRSGNRVRRFPPEVYALMDTVAAEEYEHRRNVTVRTAHRALIVRCEEVGLAVPSYNAFLRFLNERPHGRAVAKRKGHKEAAAQAPPLGPRDPTVHGQAPLDVVHIDATQLDLWIRYGPPDEPLLLRPWLTVALCAWSRVVVGYTLSFDPPSVYTLFTALRDTLERQGRAPNRMVVDRGAEFASVDFEVTCAAYVVEIMSRPPGRPRFGALVERFFHTLNKHLVHTLSGNTQLLKDSRRMTKAVNPACDTPWSLEDFDRFLRRYLFAEYPNLPHSGLGGMIPTERFRQGAQTLSVGHPLADNPDLRFMLWPFAKRRRTMVHRRYGIWVESVRYWNAVMSNPKVHRSYVEVRVDPADVGHVVAYLDGVWQLCRSFNYFEVFHGRSWRELRLAAVILRKRHRGEPTVSPTKRELRLANLLRDVRGHEELARQRMRDEAQAASSDRPALRDLVQEGAADASGPRADDVGAEDSEDSSDTSSRRRRLRDIPPGKRL